MEPPRQWRRSTSLSLSWYAALSLSRGVSQDGSAMVWDMNRLRYTRTLQTPRLDQPVKFCAINDADVSPS